MMKIGMMISASGSIWVKNSATPEDVATAPAQRRQRVAAQDASARQSTVERIEMNNELAPSDDRIVAEQLLEGDG